MFSDEDDAKSNHLSWNPSHHLLAAASASTLPFMDPPAYKQSLRRTYSIYCRTALCVLGAVSLLAYILVTAPLLVPSLSIHTHLTLQSTPVVKEYHCGKTKEEAIARGCTFDPLTVSWLPQECSRRQTDEFWADAPITKDNFTNEYEARWRYYDWDLTERYDGLADLPVYAGVHTYRSTLGEHITHCAYSK